MYTLAKPIAICRHEATQGPAYLQTFLDQHDIPYRIFAIDAGDTPPNRAAEFSGIVILGSNASANDGFSWIRREDALLQDALQRNRPILGHCFGGQMLARALGAKVRRNSVPHIGWGKVLVTTFPEAQYWMGAKRELNIFHWHFDTFEIPRGAKRMLFGHYCMNKGFAHGPHLALQSHLEVTAASIRQWCAEDQASLLKYQHLPSVQSENEIMHNLDRKVATLHQLANHTYRQWLRNILIRPELDASTSMAIQRPKGGLGWGYTLMQHEMRN
ncbi:type 1 glutamine amidotransferase [Chitinibacter sp. SCUT-21]|uniref:type 1 glutamine amidotransferase n=1 Tax=Chitinibacter sp. SCUT-21 TaxID=2970891 RepID=UPI0035A5D835